MKYCSTYLWEKGKEEHNNVSLVLQQVRVAKRVVLLGCVCGMQQIVSDQEIVIKDDVQHSKEALFAISGRFTEALVEWFHRVCLEMIEKKKSMEELEKSLRKEVEAVLKEIHHYRQKQYIKEQPEFVGILLVEQWFCLFHFGNMQMFLVNRRYNRKHMRCIVGDTRISVGSESYVAIGRDRMNGGMRCRRVRWECGEVQKKIGILLCTEGLVKGMDMTEVAELLMPEGELKEERLQKRLQELWDVRTDKAGNAAAVYIRTY